MIYDKLENLGAYSDLCSHMDTLLDWLEEHDVGELPEDSWTEIDGKAVMIKVMTAETKPDNYMDYEVHRKYLDIHTVLEGSELFEVALGATTDVRAYTDNAEVLDTALVSGPLSGNGLLNDERFAIFLPGEPHKTKIRAAECDKVRHVLIKVLYAED